MHVRDSKCQGLAAGLLQAPAPSRPRRPGPLLSVRQVAARLQGSTAVVYRLVAMRAISAVRVINSIRLAEDDVEEFLRKNRS